MKKWSKCQAHTRGYCIKCKGNVNMIHIKRVNDKGYKIITGECPKCGQKMFCV